MNMIVRITRLLPVVALSLLLASCAGSQKVAYMQTLPASGDTTTVQNHAPAQYEARIKPKDLLSITVVTSASDASRIYNLLMPQLSETTNNSLYSTPTMQTYLVENDGNIEFPILGKINVAV